MLATYIRSYRLAGRNATRRTMSPIGRSMRIAGWIFIAPNLIGVLLFTIVPLGAGLAIGFTDWDVASGLGNVTLVGLRNFSDLVSDAMFWESLGRTALYAGVGVPLTIGCGLALAMVLNRPIPGRGVLRAIFFLPYVMNVVATGMTWLLVLNPDSGLANSLLASLGIEPGPAWLVSTNWALPTLTMILVWGSVGYPMVIYLAALQDTPEELIEAAMIDGAGPWRRFRTVIWPSLLPTTAFLFVTLFTAVSQGFGSINFLTQGGPGSSTTVLSYYLYLTGFRYYRFGYASAIGIVMFVIVMSVTALMWSWQRRRSLYEEA